MNRLINGSPAPTPRHLQDDRELRTGFKVGALKIIRCGLVLGSKIIIRLRYFPKQYLLQELGGNKVIT